MRRTRPSWGRPSPSANARAVRGHNGALPFMSAEREAHGRHGTRCHVHARLTRPPAPAFVRSFFHTRRRCCSAEINVLDDTVFPLPISRNRCPTPMAAPIPMALREEGSTDLLKERAQEKPCTAGAPGFGQSCRLASPRLLTAMSHRPAAYCRRPCRTEQNSASSSLIFSSPHSTHDRDACSPSLLNSFLFRGRVSVELDRLKFCSFFPKKKCWAFSSLAFTGSPEKCRL